MNARKVELLQNEEILFESGPAVLTNQRLMANWKESLGGKPSDLAPLKEITGFEKIEGGQESNLKTAAMSAAVGGLVLLITAAIGGTNPLVESVLFLVGAGGVIAGLYLGVNSLFRPKPHTTILFQLEGSRQMAVTFPGRGNVEAEELTRRFARAKRGL